MAYKDLTTSKHDRMLSKALAAITMMIKTRKLTIEDTYKLFEDIAEHPMVDETIAQTIEMLNLGTPCEGQPESSKSGNCNLADVSGSALKEPCPEFPYFGARYPDARCINGQLYDLDRCDENGDLYEMAEYHPCPFCNTEEFMKQQEDNEADMDKVRQWIADIKKKYG